MRPLWQDQVKQHLWSEVGDLGAAASSNPVVGTQKSGIKSAELYLTLVKVKQADSKTNPLTPACLLFRPHFQNASPDRVSQPSPPEDVARNNEPIGTLAPLSTLEFPRCSKSRG